MFRSSSVIGLGALVFLTACGGPSPSEYVGAYEGTLAATEKKGERTFMSELEHLLYVAPGGDDQVAIQILDECSVLADLGDDGAFTISGQPCTYDAENRGLDGAVDGDGVIAEDGSIDCDFTINGTIRDAMGELPYEASLEFSGGRL